MKQDYTHITVILDRTGSMESIRDDTIGGFNAFLKSQKDAPGTATMTLVQFDSQDPYEIIHRFKTIDQVPELTRATFVPRASTPLLDALGRGINDLEESISKLAKDDSPSRILFVVVTDGQENASKEFRKNQIEKMIKEKTEKNDWQFVFLSADIAAIGDAKALGMRSDAMLHFQKSSSGSANAWASLAKQTSNYRAAAKPTFSFDEQDRKHPDDPKKQKS